MILIGLVAILLTMTASSVLSLEETTDFTKRITELECELSLHKLREDIESRFTSRLFKLEAVLFQIQESVSEMKSEINLEFSAMKSEFSAIKSEISAVKAETSKLPIVYLAVSVGATWVAKGLLDPLLKLAVKQFHHQIPAGAVVEYK